MTTTSMAKKIKCDDEGGDEGKQTRVLMIDNYDSFTWNVYQYLSLCGADVIVYRNDKISLEEMENLRFTHLVISPGPGCPDEAGISMKAINHFAGKIPIFGVCMGMQCMYQLYGGVVEYAGEIMHGKVSQLSHDQRGCFTGIEQGIKVTRYHSLAGRKDNIPKELYVTASLDYPTINGKSGIVQAVRHKKYCMEGVQFHPESVLSEKGMNIFKTFLSYKAGHWADDERTADLQQDRYGYSGSGEETKEKSYTIHRAMTSGDENDLKQCIKELGSSFVVKNGSIKADLIQKSMLHIISGNAKDSQVAAFLVLYQQKLITARHLLAIINSIMSQCTHVYGDGGGASLRLDDNDAIPDCVDIVGTGGDGHDTFNVSTTAGMVAAGAGLRVVKFGNRSASSKCGSADLVEGFGAKLDLDPNVAKKIVMDVGYCFLYAPAYHPALKAVAGVRKDLGLKTIFNMLGPLLNPAFPSKRIVGVYSPKIGRLMAEGLIAVGVKKAFVVCGHEQLDEISISGPTHVWDITVEDQDYLQDDNSSSSVLDKYITEYDITPNDFGLQRHDLKNMCGGDVARNKGIISGILHDKGDAFTDFVLINAAALLYVSGKATDFKHGVTLARESIKSGKALKALQDYAKLSKSA